MGTDATQEGDKKMILKDLMNTWCRLAPSGVQGVGVFAIRDIPEGTHPFSPGLEDWIGMNSDELKDIPPEVYDLIKTYCIFQDNLYYLPKYGFKLWDMVVFLNHSKNPNIVSINDGEDFITTRPIAKGEEVLIDYNTIDEDVADYYKK
jgi:hypothetical protein